MGELIDLGARRARRSAAGAMRPEPVEFLFDLADPWTYLAAERVDRDFERVRWTPASAVALARSAEAVGAERQRRAAELRAASLRLPLQWPDRFPGEVPAAMRAAAHAGEQGRGAAFVLAAGRLAFCGGFDLDDPEILAEAAAAAGVGLEDTLAAARDVSRDGPIDAAGRRLLAAGADTLPALRLGRRLICGEHRIAAATAARARIAAL